MYRKREIEDRQILAKTGRQKETYRQRETYRKREVEETGRSLRSQADRDKRIDIDK